GFGVPWAGAALPRSVPKLVRALIEEAGVPGEWLEWHGHNGFFKGHANSVAAWLYGCAAVNATLLSTGERAGNSPLEGAPIDPIPPTRPARPYTPLTSTAPPTIP